MGEAGFLRTKLPRLGDNLELIGGQKLGSHERIIEPLGPVDVYLFRQHGVEGCLANYKRGLTFKATVDRRRVTASFHETLSAEYDRNSGKMRSCAVSFAGGLLNAISLGITISEGLEEELAAMIRRGEDLAISVTPWGKGAELAFSFIENGKEVGHAAVHQVTAADFGVDEATGRRVDYVPVEDDKAGKTKDTRLAVWRGKCPLFPEMEVAVAVYDTMVVVILNSDINELLVSYPLNRSVDISGMDERRLDFDLTKKLMAASFRGVNL